ncbi:hypothetical protein [Streptomyces sp. NPDC051704]|uniref:hypothetical protein n=1 Tax=Streptomyces sp. NPDC051704 TaxID=3365671 RepID=UPI00379E1827
MSERRPWARAPAPRHLPRRPQRRAGFAFAPEAAEESATVPGKPTVTRSPGRRTLEPGTDAADH